MVHLLQQWTVVIVDGVHLAQHHIVFSEQHMQDVQRNHWQLIASTWDSHSTAIKGIKFQSLPQLVALGQINQQKH